MPLQAAYRKGEGRTEMNRRLTSIFAALVLTGAIASVSRAAHADPILGVGAVGNAVVGGLLALNADVVALNNVLVAIQNNQFIVVEAKDFLNHSINNNEVSIIQNV